MKNNTQILFIEINNTEYIFIVGEMNSNNHFNLIFKKKVPIVGFSDNRINDFDLVSKVIKENIYIIEKKLNFLFKEITLIIDNFNTSLINFTGFKKLNGSQLKKDNVTYILNDLKSKLLETEEEKTILHIFNSKYLLDKKKIDNLPIGLFGNFYSHELSFFLIDNNDYKNLQNIFEKCNLRIKKIISKKFVLGTNIINDIDKLETFLSIEINEESIDIIFFENSSLRFFQKFNFGTNLILNDISKVIALKNQIIKKILVKSNFSKDENNGSFIEREFFIDQNYRKIKKKLILEIAEARIQEIAEITIYKNINLKSFFKMYPKIFLKINDFSTQKSFENIYKNIFSNNNNYDFNFVKDFKMEETYENAFNLVQYGWKKEAIPIINVKKSFISRFFDFFFN